MRKTKRSHNDNCKLVCAVCWRKCSRTARPGEVLLIQEYVISNNTTASDHFPSGLCQTCSQTLILSVLLPSTKVIFYHCFILILLGCTHSRTDCSSNDKELRITLLCYPQLTNPRSNRFFLRPSVESVQAIIKSCNLRRLESLPQLHWMYKIKQRGFYPSN